MVNDDGIFLAAPPHRLRGAGDAQRDAAPVVGLEGGRLARGGRAVQGADLDRRVEFPREWPYYQGWNAQASNVAGTTLFHPVVDCTWQYINALTSLAAEPDGKRSMRGRLAAVHPKGAGEWLAKIGGALNLGPRIPYQPIGGLKYIRNGLRQQGQRGPRSGFAPHRAHRLRGVLLLPEPHADGPGHGPLAAGSTAPSSRPTCGRSTRPRAGTAWASGWSSPKTLSPWAPVPASQPNPVGIDGILPKGLHTPVRLVDG